LVDPADAPLAVAAETLEVPADRQFKDLAAAIDAVEADAVLTVTPPVVHVKHAELAFACGLHLLTEKPISGELGEAQRMVRLAKEAGKILMVAQNYRYSPPMQTLARLIHEKALGTLGHGHIDFYIPADFRGTFRESMPYPLLVDMTIHHLDLIRAVTGRNIAKVTAHTFNPPGSTYQHHAGLKMLLELDGGVPFSYSGDWSARGRGTTWNGAWRLQCENGVIELGTDGKITRSTSDHWHKDTRVEGVCNDGSAEQAQAALLTRFVAACHTGTPPATSGEDNLWSFGAVIAGVKSSEEGRSVDVAEMLNG
ncbi:MAG TPA: Gfo/Idh/MocA family oxidoreductase, partial [Tepidisphaeraceae bacterium]